MNDRLTRRFEEPYFSFLKGKTRFFEPARHKTCGVWTVSKTRLPMSHVNPNAAGPEMRRENQHFNTFDLKKHI